MRLILATHNPNKAREIQNKLNKNIEVLTLEDVGFQTPITEDALTFSANALKKAKVVSDAFSKDWVLADDSGLCVQALRGAPGIYSARYAGQDATDAQNNALLLENMQGQTDRQAYFHCSMVLMKCHDSVWSTEGQIHGELLTKPQGNQGFGYDPLLWIHETQCTMAQMSLPTKNTISHRAKALSKMVSILDQRLNF